MADLAKPDRDDALKAATERDAGPRRRTLLRRGTRRLLRSRRIVLQDFLNALRRPVRQGALPVWSRPMTLLAVLALAAVGVLLPLDAGISRAMLNEPDGVKAFFTYATDIGLTIVYTSPAAALLLMALFSDWHGRPWRETFRVFNFYGHVAFIFAAVLGAQTLTQTLKFIVGRARPVLIEEGGALTFSMFHGAYNFASFPSGHSTTMGAVTASAMMWFPALRVPALIVGFSFAFSRVFVRAHYPSDVVAGFTIGFLFALALARWLARRGLFFRFGADDPWRGFLPRRVGSRRYAQDHPPIWRDLYSGVRRRRAV